MRSISRVSLLCGCWQCTCSILAGAYCFPANTNSNILSTTQDAKRELSSEAKSKSVRCSNARMMMVACNSELHLQRASSSCLPIHFLLYQTPRCKGKTAQSEQTCFPRRRKTLALLRAQCSSLLFAINK